MGGEEEWELCLTRVQEDVEADQKLVTRLEPEKIQNLKGRR